MSQSKPTQPNKLVGFFHGIDPASQNDFYCDFIHMLTQKPFSNTEVQASDYKWIPQPVYILRVHHMDPNEIVSLQTKIFNRFPPMFTTIDSTREDFLASRFMRMYGESKFEALKFMNSSTSNTKFKLKQLGYAYIDAGYEWPNIPRLEKQNPSQAELFRLLKKEMMHEQMKYTQSGKITFTHPTGKHNDMVHAFEMSLNSVMNFQKKNLGFEKRHNENLLFQDAIVKAYQYRAKTLDEQWEDPIFAKLQGRDTEFD